MRKIILIFAVFSIIITACDSEFTVLVEAKQISDSEYLIVCNGKPKEGLTNDVQRAGTAKEAALLAAQYFAKEKLKKINPTSGTIRNYEFDGEIGTIYYVIEQKNIEKYIK